jgi:ribosomal protein S18 acetylase RimI-like enzyme
MREWLAGSSQKCNAAARLCRVKRDLGDGYELDDYPGRVDLDAVHAYLSGEAYWAKGRPRETQGEMNKAAARLVGLYHEGRQVGFTRTAVVPGMEVAYLYDVYVLAEHRGRGLGEALVRETVERGAYASYRWLLDTTDAHGLYERFGFGRPNDRMMERPRRA